MFTFIILHNHSIERGRHDRHDGQDHAHDQRRDEQRDVARLVQQSPWFGLQFSFR